MLAHTGEAGIEGIVSSVHVNYITGALLERVLLNLIGNAIKYTNEGALQVVAYSVDDKRVSIAV